MPSRRSGSTVFAIARSSSVYVPTMSGNRGPSVSLFGPRSGFAGMRLMWSERSIRSPALNAGLRQPQCRVPSGRTPFLFEDLLPEEREERTHRARPHEPRDGLRAAHLDPVADLKVVLLLAIEGQARRLEHAEGDGLVDIEHDRIREREMWRDRDDHDRPRRRDDERAADGHAVRGATGRGRHDEAVGPVHRERRAVDAGIDVDRPHLLPARHNDVIERQGFDVGGTGPRDAGLEQRPILAGPPAGGDLREQMVEIVERATREEAQAAEIDAEDGDAQRRQRPRRPEHRAVAAEYARDLHPGDLAGKSGGVERELDHLVATSTRALGAVVGRVHRELPIGPYREGELHSAASAARSRMRPGVSPGSPWRLCMKISRLPSRPARCDAAMATVPIPTAVNASATATTAAARSFGSRTMPPRPTASRPASNCGLTSATTSPPSRR